MMVQGSTDTIPQIKQTRYLEALSKEELASLPSPRILNTHIRFDDISEDIKRRKAKVVLIHRNPKDVAASLYNHEKNLVGLYENYHVKWENWFPMFLEGKGTEFRLLFSSLNDNNLQHLFKIIIIKYDIFVMCYGQQ